MEKSQKRKQDVGSSPPIFFVRKIFAVDEAKITKISALFAKILWFANRTVTNYIVMMPAKLSSELTQTLAAVIYRVPHKLYNVCYVVGSFFFNIHYFQTRRNESCNLYDMTDVKAIYFIFLVRSCAFSILCDNSVVCIFLITLFVWWNLFLLIQFTSAKTDFVKRLNVYPVTSSYIPGMWYEYSLYFLSVYRGADKSLARPGGKQATATENFEFYISYL